MSEILFHSTNGGVADVTFPHAIENGLAADGGLFMPEKMPVLPSALYRNIPEMSLREIGYVVCNTLLGGLVGSAEIKALVDDALDFPVPLRATGSDGLYIMELFHGPTMSFKDAGARFLARLLPMLFPGRKFNIILATSGDSGGALANSFRDVKGARVFVLYPRGELSSRQIEMFSGIPNVKGIEVGGTFDDCQNLVRQALLDKEINAVSPLTSGNSINIGRQFASIIYYFHAYARAKELHPNASTVTVSIPCGNLGNLSAALMAKKMGLPVEKFIGANNANDTFVEYLQTGGLRPRRALMTLARAMDVGNPSNLARIIDLYNGDLDRLREDVEGVAFTDREIIESIREMYDTDGYLMGPQSATAYRALKGRTGRRDVGVVMATGHPYKFPRATMEAVGHLAPSPAVASGPARRSSQPSVKIPPSMTVLSRILLGN